LFARASSSSPKREGRSDPCSLCSWVRGARRSQACARLFSCCVHRRLDRRRAVLAPSLDPHGRGWVLVTHPHNTIKETRGSGWTGCGQQRGCHTPFRVGPTNARRGAIRCGASSHVLACGEHVWSSTRPRPTGTPKGTLTCNLCVWWPFDCDIVDNLHTIDLCASGDSEPVVTAYARV